MKKHLLAAHNFFLGVTNLLILPLPDPWQLLDNITPPEIDSSFTYENIPWVTSGSASYSISAPDRSLVIELLLQIKRGSTQQFKPALRQIESQGFLFIREHSAVYTTGKISKGLFKKRLEEGLEVLLPCEVLRRTLHLTFTGNCPEEAIQEILEVIPHIECH